MQCNLERNACIVHTFTHTYTCVPCQVPESERALDSTLAHRTLVSDTCILRRDARTSPTRVGHSGPHGASDEHNKNTATPLGKCSLCSFVCPVRAAHFGGGKWSFVCPIAYSVPSDVTAGASGVPNPAENGS
jgi:hypothetical protein